MKEPIKILLLPTEDTNLGAELKNTIYKHSENKSLVIGYLNARSTRHIPHHVYITISQEVEDIKVGDWFINEEGIISICTDTQTLEDGEILLNCGKADFSESYLKDCSKIIATTDLKLKLKCFCSESEAIYCGSKCQKPILQVQQSFLEEFVDNLDGEYEVDYETKCYCGHTITCDCGEIEEKPFIQILKLNQDNTINITSVEKKMYSKKKVESLLFQYAEDEHAWFSCKSEIKSFNNWIKKNL